MMPGSNIKLLLRSAKVFQLKTDICIELYVSMKLSSATRNFYNKYTSAYKMT